MSWHRNVVGKVSDTSDSIHNNAWLENVWKTCLHIVSPWKGKQGSGEVQTLKLLELWGLSTSHIMHTLTTATHTLYTEKCQQGIKGTAHLVVTDTKVACIRGKRAVRFLSAKEILPNMADAACQSEVPRPDRHSLCPSPNSQLMHLHTHVKIKIHKKDMLMLELVYIFFIEWRWCTAYLSPQESIRFDTKWNAIAEIYSVVKGGKWIDRLGSNRTYFILRGCNNRCQYFMQSNLAIDHNSSSYTQNISGLT